MPNHHVAMPTGWTSDITYGGVDFVTDRLDPQIEGKREILVRAFCLIGFVAITGRASQRLKWNYAGVRSQCGGTTSIELGQ